MTTENFRQINQEGFNLCVTNKTLYQNRGSMMDAKVCVEFLCCFICVVGRKKCSGYPVPREKKTFIQFPVSHTSFRSLLTFIHRLFLTANKITSQFESSVFMVTKISTQTHLQAKLCTRVISQVRHYTRQQPWPRASQ